MESCGGWSGGVSRRKRAGSRAPRSQSLFFVEGQGRSGFGEGVDQERDCAAEADRRVDHQPFRMRCEGESIHRGGGRERSGDCWCGVTADGRAEIVGCDEQRDLESDEAEIDSRGHRPGGCGAGTGNDLDAFREMGKRETNEDETDGEDAGSCDCVGGGVFP